MAGQQNPFDQFEGLFGSSSFPKTEDKPEMGVSWNAKEINGELFLPASQVVELLAVNSVLPKMQAALNRHVKKE